MSDQTAQPGQAPQLEVRPEFKFQVLQKNLATALGQVAHAVATRSTLPVLSNILVMALPESKLRIAATNLEMAIVVYVPAKVQTDGGTTLPARTFVDLVSALPEEELLKFSLKARTETTTIKHGEKKVAESNIRGITDVEFPLLPAHDVVLAKVSGEVLCNAIAGCTPFAEQTGTRPILNGVLMRFHADKKNNGFITLAASDGFRLAVRHVALPEPPDKAHDLIVPTRALNEVVRLLGKEPTVTINVNTNKSSVKFASETVEIIIQLIDGNFPDYNQIVPKKYEMQATLNRKHLIAKLKAARVFARESANIVRLEVKDGWFKVVSRSAETGDFEDGLDAQSVGALIWASDCNYFIQALEGYDTDEVIIRGTTESSPFTVRGVGDETGSLYVIMPMNLGDRGGSATPAKAQEPATPEPAPAPTN